LVVYVDPRHILLLRYKTSRLSVMLAIFNSIRTQANAVTDNG
jgi:hypothetical protein